MVWICSESKEKLGDGEELGVARRQNYRNLRTLVRG